MFPSSGKFPSSIKQLIRVLKINKLTHSNKVKWDPRTGVKLGEN